MTREDLLQSKEYWLSKLQIDLFNEVEKYMKENKLSRTQFASKLGVSKGYISQILNGEADHRLSKLVELALAIGLAPTLTYENLEELKNRDMFGLYFASKCEIEKSEYLLKMSGYLLAYPSINQEVCASTVEHNNAWSKMPTDINSGKLKTAS